ncbi:MAG: hypothetical protein ACTHQQ_01245, partial [Solirubrobacteraceae bacterium]
WRRSHALPRPSGSAVTAGPRIVGPVNHGRILRREQQPKPALDERGELVLVDRCVSVELAC